MKNKFLLLLFLFLNLTTTAQESLRLGQIDVLKNDLGIMNYYKAKDAIESLGQGWRLPSESELSLLLQYKDDLGLSLRPTIVNGNIVGSYLGGSFSGYYKMLITNNESAAYGNVYERSWDSNSKQNFYFFVRAVKNVSEQINKNSYSKSAEGNLSTANQSQGCETIILSYEKFAKEFIKYCNTKKVGTVKSNMGEFVKWTKEVRRQNDLVMKCSTGKNRLRVLKTMEKVYSASQLVYGISTAKISNNSTAFKSPSTSNSKSNKQSSHPYKVIISWNNQVSSNSYQKPTAQNGIVEYFYERSGSYSVKPICPVCSKKQYNSISGFATGRDSKIVTINCN